VAAYRRVYDSRHLQADCQEPGSAPEPDAQSVIDYWFLFTGNGQPKDRHCASCIGTLSFPIVSAAGNPRYAIGRRLDKKNAAAAAVPARCPVPGDVRLHGVSLPNARSAENNVISHRPSTVCLAARFLM